MQPKSSCALNSTAFSFSGVHEPPISVTGKPLPASRLLSIALFPDVDVPDPKWTLAAMQWGQIITHDMSIASGTTQSRKSFLSAKNRAIGQIIF